MPSKKAQIAITLDLEMARNFPKWEDLFWDYEKGNLNDEAKNWSVEAARRVKAAGGVIHFFLVGQVLEQQNVDWLKGLIKEGHPIGNHTYDHVYVRAERREDIQFRFARCPWLIEGKTIPQVIEQNIHLCTAAMKDRLGISPAGFRTPGGFNDGLDTRPDVREMLKKQGFSWVSSRYPAHKYGKPTEQPTQEVIDSIIKAQSDAQPFKYPDGLIEIPMNPISDIGAFRNGRWKLDWFVGAIRRGVEWAIENRAVFDFLGHPSVGYAMDPEFRVIDAILETVNKSNDRAILTDLNTIARSV